MKAVKFSKGRRGARKKAALGRCSKTRELHVHFFCMMRGLSQRVILCACAYIIREGDVWVCAVSLCPGRVFFYCFAAFVRGSECVWNRGDQCGAARRRRWKNLKLWWAGVGCIQIIHREVSRGGIQSCALTFPSIHFCMGRSARMLFFNAMIFLWISRLCLFHQFLRYYF